MTTTRVNTRELVLEILMQVTGEEEFSHIAIRGVLDKYAWMDRKDRAFIKRLSEGTLEQMIRLDYIIGLFSSVSVAKLKPVILNILRMGVYQMLFMDQVPDSAACNEAVKLAGRKGFGSLKGFVNGVLRAVARNRDKISYPGPDEGRLRYLSVKYSMPEWIAGRWLTEYGPETTEQILSGLLKERPVAVRCNLAACAEEELKRELLREGIRAEALEGLPYAFCLEGIDSVAKSSAFQRGLYTVQDLSSMLAVEAAAPAPGDHIIDVCASPGGKAAHLAQKTGPDGFVEARDLTDHKVELMRESFDRLKLSNISARRQDALSPDPGSEGKADLLLADLPCSGLGVIGRKKDIKYRLKPEQITELSQLQRRILRTVSAYVRPGGVLVYTTCTVSRQENEENVRWIAENLPFQAESIEPYLPEAYRTGTEREGYVQLLPGVHDCDGFFISRFRRNRS